MGAVIIEKFDGQDIGIIKCELEIGEKLLIDSESKGYEFTSSSKISGLKETLKKVVQSISKDISSISSEMKPTETEIEFSMGLESSSNLWVIGAKGSFDIKLKLTWK